MKSWKIILLTGVFTLAMLAVAGCESDPVAPQETVDMDGETAEQWSRQAIGMINQMAASVPPASQGDFSTLGPDKSVEGPTWDEVQMAWTLDQTATFSEGDPPTSSGETRVSCRASGALWLRSLCWYAASLSSVIEGMSSTLLSAGARVQRSCASMSRVLLTCRGAALRQRQATGSFSLEGARRLRLG